MRINSLLTPPQQYPRIAWKLTSGDSENRKSRNGAGGHNGEHALNATREPPKNKQIVRSIDPNAWKAVRSIASRRPKLPIRNSSRVNHLTSVKIPR